MIPEGAVREEIEAQPVVPRDVRIRFGHKISTLPSIAGTEIRPSWSGWIFWKYERSPEIGPFPMN